MMVNTPELCPHPPDRIWEMDHYGHPTGELWCHDCFDYIQEVREPAPCTADDCWCRVPEADLPAWRQRRFGHT